MKILQIILVVSFALFRCTTENSLSDTGGSTETVGMVYSVDGEPAEDVIIEFVPVDYVDINQNSFDTAKSNDMGQFTFEMIDDGHYNLNYKKDGLVAFHKSVKIENGASSEIISDTIKFSGAIQGVVQLRKEHDNRETFIILKGTNRFCQVQDSVGNFTIDSIAEGVYDVTILTSYSYYESIDTTWEFYSGGTDTLDDTLVLKYIGIDIPDSLITQYDSYLQQVSLSWNPVDTSNFGGYQICRKEFGSADNYSVLKSFIRDTFYIDPNEETNIVQGNRYLYKISALDKYGASGKYTNPVEVIFNSAFEEEEYLFINKLNSSKLGGVVSDKEGNLFVVCSDTSLLYKVSYKNQQILEAFQLPDDCKPFDITILENNTLMIAGDVGCYNVDKNGKQLYRYSVYTTDIVTVDSTYLYYTASSEFYLSPDMIIRLNVLNGLRDTIIAGGFNTITSFNIDNDSIYVMSSSFGSGELSRLVLGTAKKETLYLFKSSSDNTDMIINDSIVTLLTGNLIIALDRNTKKIYSRFSLTEGAGSVTQCAGDSLMVLNNSGFICTVKRR